MGYVADVIRARNRKRSLWPGIARAQLAALNAGEEAARPKPAGYVDQNSVFAEYVDRPVEFIRDHLGYELEVPLPEGSACFTERGQREGVADYQARIARALVQFDKVAVRSGHKLGKSLLAVLLAIWWVCTRPEGRVVLTSATDRQVKRVLWRELRNVYRRLKRRGIELMPEPHLDPATGCQWEDGREIVGFSTKTAENAAGFSGASLLFILDEGSGIPTDIYEAFAGNAAGGAKMLALANPTQTVGWFFEAFGIRREFWETFHLSIQDSPNFRAGRPIVSGMATAAYEAETREAYGVESPFYQVRVAGNFPTHVPNAVIGLGMVEAARERWAGSDTAGTILTIGVDVARFGDDDSSVSGRRGLRLFSPKYFLDQHQLESVVHGYDSTKVAGLVVQCINAERKPGEVVKVNIDAAGGYGGAVADRLRELKAAGGLDALVYIIEVNVAVTATDVEKYPRLRDEAWFGMRAFFNAGGAMYPDPRLESELIAPKYAPTLKGQFQVEKKEETKKTLGRSPDRADSAVLAVYEGGGVALKDVKQPSAKAQTRWAGSGRGYG